MVGGRTRGASGDGGANNYRQRRPSHAEGSETDSIPETIPLPNVDGGEQDHPAQIADSSGSQPVEHEGRDAGRIAGSTRTIVGISGGDVEERLPPILLAASVSWNVKRI